MTRARLASGLCLSWLLFAGLLAPPVIHAQTPTEHLALPAIMRGIQKLIGAPLHVLSNRHLPNLKGLVVTRQGSDDIAMDLFLSQDQGRTWSRVAQQPWPTQRYDTSSGLTFYLLLLDGAPLWVAAQTYTDHPRLWVSRDGGESWTERDLPTSPLCADRITLTDLMNTPARPGRLWATMLCGLTATRNEIGVFYSDDGGASWTTLDPFTDPPGAWLAGPVGSATDSDLLYRRGPQWTRSADGGAHWARVSIPTDFLYVSPNDARVLLSSGTYSSDSYFSSTDGGRTWRSWKAIPCTSGGVFMLNAGFVRGDPETLIGVCFSGELFRSPDLGQTWSLLTTLDGQPYWVAWDDAIPNCEYAVIHPTANGGDAYSLLLSSDGGYNWQDIVAFH